MGVHLLVLPFKMGIYRKRNVHGIGSSLAFAGVSTAHFASLCPIIGFCWGINRTFCISMSLLLASFQTNIRIKFKLQVINYTLQIVTYRFQISNYKPQNSNHRLQLAYHKSQITTCISQTAYHNSQITTCISQTVNHRLSVFNCTL